MSKVTLTLSSASSSPITFELLTSLVPKTCQHFTTLLEKQIYNTAPITRLVKNGWLQGDVTDAGSVTDIVSIPDESFAVPFTSKYILGFTNQGPHSSKTGFFVTLAENAEWLSGRYVGFGRCVSGSEVLDGINEMEVGEDERVDGVTVVSWVVSE